MKAKIEDVNNIEMLDVQNLNAFQFILENSLFVLRKYEMPESCSDIMLDIINAAKHGKLRNENQITKRAK